MAGSKDHRREIFLEKLRQARLKAGLTQAEVAGALRKPQSFVSKVEMGERRLDVLELEEIARLYRVELNFFSTLGESKRGRRERS